MKAQQIRSKFLEFFKDKGHQIVPSAPLVIKNDPTLMFTNAGMNQFKDFFLGNRKPEVPRIADTQKCLRVSGKHNDLEEVGIDTYHHTMFEMLGNWSFGNYFKKEAIAWAWELLTEVYQLPVEHMYATVFEGDKEDGLPADDEAASLWRQFLPEERILFATKKDNFWEMGDTGPCGPCTEIHIDLRNPEERSLKPGRELVNQDHPQVIEIWNLVFIQFNRLANRKLEKLPAAHVDTGMGFERLTMAIQGKQSNYDTDIFQPIIQQVAGVAGVRYGDNEKVDIALRVVADHIRAIAFAIADGQMPSNNRAGYVIRRILRRAVRYGYTFLNFREPFMHSLVPTLAQQFAEVFPELKAQEAFIAKSVREEEASFLRTLDNGLGILNKLIEEDKGQRLIAGEDAFLLYDTYGFPFDLTSLIARENGFSVDKAGFDLALEQQKNRSRQDAASETGDWTVVYDADSTEFIGYDELMAETRILKHREVKQKKGSQFQLVLEQTPFYAESGGQVGDTGMLKVGEEIVPVLDTVKENDLFIHIVKKLPTDPTLPVQAFVDADKRRVTAANHSATHLLHAALRQVLGTHVQQRGSLVNDQYLRFDFSHFAKMTDEELAQVEQIVNQRIRQNISLNERRNVPIEEAKSLGAMALFGEKYGDFVRVITFDPDYSVELCGGTHVPATGQLGLFKITAESSIAAGVRRIEAICGIAAERYVRQKEQLLLELDSLLRNPKDLRKAVESLLDEKAQLSKNLDKMWHQALQQTKAALLEQVQEKEGLSFLAAKVELPNPDSLRTLAFELRAKITNLAGVLAAEVNGKPTLAVILSDELVSQRGMDASKIVRELAKEIQGGGGGQAFFATAGGKNTEGIDRALAKAAGLIFE